MRGSDRTSATGGVPRGNQPLRYAIRLDGHLHTRWAAWFDALSLSTDSDGTTLMHVAVVDQAALHGLVVVAPLKDWTCAGCGGTGTFLLMEDDAPLCLTCADLDHLVFLPAGDATLTRRARKASRLSAVVVRFSRARKRYERQGILVEEQALQDAETSCLADAEARALRRARDEKRRLEADGQLVERLALQIRRLFPGCPPGRADAIAAHTAARGSGRVGRSAAGQRLDEQAVQLAVVASVRHRDTDYDVLLMAGVPREQARRRVRDDVDAVLERWRTG